MPLLSDEKLLKQWNKHKEISEGELNYQHNQAREAHLYAAGDEALYRAGIQEKTAKNQVVFSKIKPFVDAVAGFMVQLRRKPQYQARIMEREAQEEYSAYLNAVSDYIRDNANMDNIESRQDREMLIAGYGAVDTNITYEKNPDGEVAAEVIKYNDVFWDPQAMEPNMLDGRWIYRRKAYGIDEALKRFKGSAKEDFEIYSPDRDSGYYYIPGGLYDKIAPEGTKEEDLVEVNYYQYWQLDKYYRAENPLFMDVLDPATASILAQMMVTVRDNRAQLSDKDKQEDIFGFDPFAEYLVMNPQVRSDMRVLFERFGLELEDQEFLRKTYYTVILSGKKIFKKFKSPDQQGFTIKLKTANYDPVKKAWYGMVEGMINPARYANKALSEILYVIASNSKGGVMYEESAVDDPARFEQQYATTKAAIRVNDGALSGAKIQPKAQAALPSGYEQVYNISNESLDQTSGISREFLGTSANTQVSALLESQRINQVISTLAGYFDSISLYQKEHARMMITYIRMLAENSQGRLISLIGQEGAQRYDVLSQDKMVDEYDIEIGEAPATPAQKQETAKVVIELADKLFAAGQNIYPFVIDYIPGLKQVDKQRIRDAILPDPQTVAAQQEAAQQQAAIDQAVQTAIADATRAKAERDIAEKDKAIAQTDETLAKTAKTLEEANQKAVETQFLKQGPPKDVNVNI